MERVANRGDPQRAREDPTRNVTTAEEKGTSQSTAPREREKERAMKEKELMERTGHDHCHLYFTGGASRAEKRGTHGDTAQKGNQKERGKASTKSPIGEAKWKVQLEDKVKRKPREHKGRSTSGEACHQ